MPLSSKQQQQFRDRMELPFVQCVCYGVPGVVYKKLPLAPDIVKCHQLKGERERRSDDLCRATAA